LIFTVETEELVEQALLHMEASNDVRWSIGMALQELYPDVILKVQMQMVEKFMDGVEQ
jgi:hypothetical protein